ncbi:hypothetical protein [Aeromonas veronii]|uniref:Uncharacterized protein n=1 Tax=Aeromonas veronii TaxID=654 RepID=A0A4S5CGZ5_AERVE|nr:hypothetical protein [Aeromonas veronii]THJ45117.1 hypothetical protein E8Q35_13120 [Aeromonas veronii]
MQNNMMNELDSFLGSKEAESKPQDLTPAQGTVSQDAKKRRVIPKCIPLSVARPPEAEAKQKEDDVVPGLKKTPDDEQGCRVRGGFSLGGVNIDITNNADIPKALHKSFFDVNEDDFINGTNWLLADAATKKAAYKWFSDLEHMGFKVTVAHAVKWMSSGTVDIPLSTGNSIEIKKNVANFDAVPSEYEEIAKLIISAAKSGAIKPTIWGDDEFISSVSKFIEDAGVKVNVITLEQAQSQGFIQADEAKHVAGPANSENKKDPKIILPSLSTSPRSSQKII